MELQSANIVIGGEAGQGLATVGQLLTKALVRAGYHVAVTQDYQSRIRGGHNTFAIRAGLDPLGAPIESIDVLVALNQETVALHKAQLAPGGLLLLEETLDPEGLPHVAIPYKSLIPKAIFENVAALGILSGLLGLDRAIPAALVTEQFVKKGQEVVDQNLTVLHAAADWLAGQAPAFGPLAPAPARAPRLTMNGNEAFALGALAAGCRFCSYYPMTPATSVPMLLAAHAETMGLVVEQAEDEIAAINMVAGASYAGARSLVATAGGGFALMVEGVSLLGMTETPAVIFLGQRPAPATGLPTRTDQGDLNLALYAGHGEFPRAILAPGSVEDCFHLAVRAFDLAEASQGPVFVLSDQFLADSLRDVEPFDLAALPAPVLPDLTDDTPRDYVRYAYTASGVSPRRLPCHGESLVVLDSDEHTPDGHITEDHGVRILMHEKRLRKHETLAEQVIPPVLDGPADGLLLVCWGSSLGAVKEAAQVLRRQGQTVGVLHFTQVWPLVPSTFLPLLQQAEKVAMVEGNYHGQLAKCIRMETGFHIRTLIPRYDGLPFTARYILDRL